MNQGGYGGLPLMVANISVYQCQLTIVAIANDMLVSACHRLTPACL